MERSRRTFLAWSGIAAAGAALTAAGARILGARTGAPGTAAPEGLVIPPATRSIPAGLPTPVTGTGLDVPGVSPLLTPTAEFFRIDVADAPPRVDLDSWRLHVRGGVDRPLTLSFDDLLSLPQVQAPITLACVSNRVDGGLIGTAMWQGVELSTLLDMAGVREGSDQLVGRSVDGFTAGFPTAAARDGRAALVAIAMNGEPLSATHGFPARLVVAGLFGYVSATKWLDAIELTTWDGFDGYWVPRGWAKSGPVVESSRFDTPADGAIVPAGIVTFGGVAWAPMAGVAAVEVRVDGGPWQRAELGEDIGDGAWRQWRWNWDATRGTHAVTVRTIDRDGRVQDATPGSPFPAGATGLAERTINVR